MTDTSSAQPPSAPTTTRPVAVVTGASIGIGAATARRLAADGFHVVVAARRRERLEPLAAEIGGTAITLDVTDQASVDALAAAVPACTLLVNNAGGARGMDPIESADVEQWQWMYDANVLGTLRMTKALLPALEASGRGHIIVVTSIAGHLVYEGGAGYTAAKHAQTALVETLRLELNGRPIRVSEIAPGMVATEEFSLRRLGGNRDAADAVYSGVPEPLTADDVADCIGWVATRPSHVDIDSLTVKPLAQAAPYKVHKVNDPPDGAP